MLHDAARAVEERRLPMPLLTAVATELGNRQGQYEPRGVVAEQPSP